MVCPNRILVFPLPLRERVTDPSATRVGRARGSFVFLTMQRTPRPARTSQSSVLVARGSPRPAERSPASRHCRRSRLWSAGPSTMPERVPAIARPSGLRTPLRAEAKLDKLPALGLQKLVAAIEKFVPRSEIDERYLYSTYSLTTENKVGQDAFAVIREAMRRKG